MSGKDALIAAFEQEFIKAVRLEIEGEVQQSLELLEGFYEQHKAEDEDGWLRNAVFFHQAEVLEEQGKHEAALELHRRVNTPPKERVRYLMNCWCIARLLVRLGDPEQALEVIGEAIDQVQGDAPEPLDMDLLSLFAQVAAQMKRGMPLRFRPLVERNVQRWGIAALPGELDDPLGLVQVALRTAHARTPEAQQADYRRQREKRKADEIRG